MHCGNGRMDSKTIGRIIRDTREALGMRQDELASVAVLSTRSLSAMQNGKPTARLELLLNALSAMGLVVILTPSADITIPISVHPTWNSRSIFMTALAAIWR